MARFMAWLPVGISPVRTSMVRSDSRRMPNVRPVRAIETVRYENIMARAMPAVKPITRGSDHWPLANSIPAAIGDRKSTRLNSSHDQISYAVFCLKKKKKKIIHVTKYKKKRKIKLQQKNTSKN